MNEKTYKLLNKIREFPLLILRILFYPIKILALPLVIITGFFIINWENQWDRNYFKKEIKWWSKI